MWCAVASRTIELLTLWQAGCRSEPVSPQSGPRAHSFARHPVDGVLSLARRRRRGLDPGRPHDIRRRLPCRQRAAAGNYALVASLDRVLGMADPRESRSRVYRRMGPAAARILGTGG